MNKIPLIPIYEHWGKVAAGVLPICKSTGRILIGMRSRHVFEPNTFSGFGGKVSEPDDDQEDYHGEITPELIVYTAKNELEEETGYGDDIELIKTYVYRDGDFEYHNFWGIVPEEFEPELNWENDYAEWVTLSQLKKLRPKHFGLTDLLKNSIGELEDILNQ